MAGDAPPHENTGSISPSTDPRRKPMSLHIQNKARKRTLAAPVYEFLQQRRGKTSSGPTIEWNPVVSLSHKQNRPSSSDTHTHSCSHSEGSSRLATLVGHIPIISPKPCNRRRRENGAWKQPPYSSALEPLSLPKLSLSIFVGKILIKRPCVAFLSIRVLCPFCRFRRRAVPQTIQKHEMDRF